MKVINYRTLTQQRLAIEEEALAEAARSESAITTVDDLIEINSPDVELEEGLDRIAQEADDAFDGIVVLQNIVEANDRIEGEPNEVEMRMARVAMESALYKLGMEDAIVPYGAYQARVGEAGPAEKKAHASLLQKVKSIIQRGIEIVIAALKNIKDWFVDFYDMLFGEAKSLAAKTEKLSERFKKLSDVWGQYEGQSAPEVATGMGDLMSVGLLNHEIDLSKVKTAINQIHETSKNYREISKLIPGMGAAVADGDADMVKVFVTKIGQFAVKHAEKFQPRHGLDMVAFGKKMEKEYRGFELVGPTFVFFPELDDAAMAELKEYAGHKAVKDVTEGNAQNTDVQEGIKMMRKFAIRAQAKFDIGGKIILKGATAKFKVLSGGLIAPMIDITGSSARELVGSRGDGREATKVADKLLSEAQKQRGELMRQVDKDDAALKSMNARVNNLVSFNSAVTYMLFQSVRDLDTAGISVAKALYRLALANVVSVEKLSAKAA